MSAVPHRILRVLHSGHRTTRPPQSDTQAFIPNPLLTGAAGQGEARPDVWRADHIRHDAAHEWFSANRKEGWATCPITEIGLVRILSNVV